MSKTSIIREVPTIRGPSDFHFPVFHINISHHPKVLSRNRYHSKLVSSAGARLMLSAQPPTQPSAAALATLAERVAVGRARARGCSHRLTRAAERRVRVGEGDSGDGAE